MRCNNTGSPTFLMCFCMNCIFVIDAAAKHLISRSFLQCGVSAVTMAAHKNCFKQLNHIFITTYSFRYTRCSAEAWQLDFDDFGQLDFDDRETVFRCPVLLLHGCQPIDLNACFSLICISYVELCQCKEINLLTW